MSSFKFSIVIPTCRREDLLAKCLESVQPGAQAGDTGPYEVIVTDDARGKTAEAMMKARFPWAKWVQGPTRGPAANRNNGANHATGEWICFIDDDCIAGKNWVAAIHAASADESLDLIEGQTTIPDQIDSPFQHVVSNHTGGVYWSCNLVVRRKCFSSLGGFDEDFLEAASEDMEFAHRFHARQFRSRFFPEALVYHPGRPMNWAGIRKRFLIIRWDALYRYKVDEGLHLSDSVAKNFLRAFKDFVLDRLRITWRDLKRWNAPYWKTRTFWLVTRWLTFPFILPYYLYWVCRFHHQLNARQQAHESKPA